MSHISNSACLSLWGSISIDETAVVLMVTDALGFSMCVCVLLVSEAVLLIHRRCDCRQPPSAVFSRLYGAGRVCYTAARHWRLCICFCVCAWVSERLCKLCVCMNEKQACICVFFLIFLHEVIHVSMLSCEAFKCVFVCVWASVCILEGLFSVMYVWVVSHVSRLSHAVSVWGCMHV